MKHSFYILSNFTQTVQHEVLLQTIEIKYFTIQTFLSSQGIICRNYFPAIIENEITSVKQGLKLHFCS